jgi:hypothetical protein
MRDRDSIRRTVDEAERGLYRTPMPGVAGRIDPPGSYAELPVTAHDPFAPGVAPPPSGIPAHVALPPARRPEDWTYPEDSGVGDARRLVGYRVRALDGWGGRIDGASAEVGGSSLVVRGGLTSLGRRYLLPAGTVTRIDERRRVVYVDRPKGGIEGAPRYRQPTRTRT